jgi:hypothetical protein
LDLNVQAEILEPLDTKFDALQKSFEKVGLGIVEAVKDIAKSILVGISPIKS